MFPAALLHSILKGGAILRTKISADDIIIEIGAWILIFSTIACFRVAYIILTHGVLRPQMLIGCIPVVFYILTFAFDSSV